MLYRLHNRLPAMADDCNCPLPIIGIGEILHFVIYSGCAFCDHQQAIVKSKIDLTVSETTLITLRVGVLRKAEYLEWFELLGKPLNELPEMDGMIGFR